MRTVFYNDSAIRKRVRDSLCTCDLFARFEGIKLSMAKYMHTRTWTNHLVKRRQSIRLKTPDVC